LEERWNSGLLTIFGLASVSLLAVQMIKVAVDRRRWLSSTLTSLGNQPQ
jgi:hypothetical protein